MNGLARSIPPAMPLVVPVVQQHIDDCIALRHVRSVHLRSPHVALSRLRRLDDRLQAHLDGVQVAGRAGLSLMAEGLASPTRGLLFGLTVVALRTKDAERLTRLVEIAAALPEVAPGLVSALGWVSAGDLQGTVRALLGSKVALHREWGLMACAMHQVDSGTLLGRACSDVDPHVRARAWRVIGQAGRLDLADQARDVLGARAAAASEGDVARAAAAALTLWGMGQHDGVRDVLLRPVGDADLPCEHAHRLAALSAPLAWGRDQIRALAAMVSPSAAHRRRLFRLAGWVGDVQCIPWLISQMEDKAWARQAGEAFSMITGADLALEDMERSPPEGDPEVPNAEPDDEDVSMDEDEDLPWPDPAAVHAWWKTHAGRFAPGQRYIGGQQPSQAHCVRLLQEQGQRQRRAAAEHLCLLRPGNFLFPVSAPAWRQSRWLAAMSLAGS